MSTRILALGSGKLPERKEIVLSLPPGLPQLSAGSPQPISAIT